MNGVRSSESSMFTSLTKIGKLVTHCLPTPPVNVPPFVNIPFVIVFSYLALHKHFCASFTQSKFNCTGFSLPVKNRSLEFRKVGISCSNE